MVTCAILLFDQVDLMDVAGPYEVLLTASRLQRRRGQEPTFDVVTVAATDVEVTAYGGLRLLADRRVTDVDRADVLIVPGAIAISEIATDDAVMSALQQMAQRSEITASVCTGAFLLEHAGLLQGRSATTHWEDVPALAERIGEDRVRDDVRWVDTGEVVTSGGLSSGIAMALHLVQRLASRGLADATARQLDYVWDPQRPAEANPA